MSHPVLLRAYLENIQALIPPGQAEEAKCLAQHALAMLEEWAMPSPSSPATLPISYSARLDPGRKRAGKPNEDYAFATTFVRRSASSPLPKVGGLLLIADGMGGHAKGADAAHWAIHTAVDWLLPRLVNQQIPETEIPALLLQSIQQANQAVYLQNLTLEGKATAKMGTTISLACAFGTRLYIANVGDSRAYLLRRGKRLRQITRDHSVVADLVAAGEIDEQASYTHPQRNVIYRNLGAKPQVEVDLFCEEIEDDDRVLLCTDGLWEMLPDVRCIEEVLCSPLGVEGMTKRLIHLACSAGGHDNIGVVVARMCMPAVQDMPTLLMPPPPPVLEPSRMPQAVRA